MRKIVLLLFCAFFYENILFGQNGVLENANNYFWNNLYNRYQDLPSGFSSDEEYIRETNEHNYQVRQDLDRMRRESEERIKNIYLNVPNIVEKELSSHQVNAPTTSSSNTSSTYNTSNTYKSTGDYTVYKSGGLQIEVDNSPLRTPEKNNYYAQQKQKKAQRDAQRAAFNEERRRRMEEAARIAAIKKQMEDARKRKLYKENYIAATQADIDKTNAIADAKATIGRQAVLDRTSELWSQRYYKQEYVPVSPELKSSVDLSSIVSSEFKDRNVIDLLGVGTSNYYDYQTSLLLAMKKNETKLELPEFKSKKERKKENQVWANLRENLDTMQLKGIYSMMESMGEKVKITEEDENGNTITIEKTAFPKVIGINNEGNCIFESEDGKRIFSVSPKGVLTYATFEEHFWDDENIIKKINDGSLLNDVEVSDSYGNASVYKVDKNGIKTNLSYKLGKDNNILPDVKLKMKMSIFDNSSTIKAEKIYFAPQSMGSIVIGVGGELSSGGKAEASLNIGAGIITKDDDIRWGEKKGLKADVTTTKAHGNVMVGKIIKQGNDYVLAYGKIDGGVDVKLDLKTIVTLNPARLTGKININYKKLNINNSEIPGYSKQ